MIGLILVRILTQPRIAYTVANIMVYLISSLTKESLMEEVRMFYPFLDPSSVTESTEDLML